MLREYMKKIFDLKKVIQVFIYALLPGIVFYSLSLNILYANGYETMEIIRDFAQQMEESSFLGFLSNIGSWLWVSSAAIGFFGFFILGTGRYKELLFLLGLFSLLLAIDDFFMIHDRYIDQNICYAAYALLALLLLTRYLREISESNGFAFFFSGTLLAMSIFTDLIQDYLPFHYSTTQIFEEGFKFTGAVIWLYFISTTLAYYITAMTDNRKQKKRKR